MDQRSRWVICALFLVNALSGLWVPGPIAATLSISCGAVGKELAFCKSGAQAWGR